FPWIRTGIIDLNRIRNKVAHNIHYKLSPEDLKLVLSPVLRSQKVQGIQSKLTGVEFIKELANQAALSLYFNANRFSKASKHGLGAFRLLEEQGYWDIPEE